MWKITMCGAVLQDIFWLISYDRSLDVYEVSEAYLIGVLNGSHHTVASASQSCSLRLDEVHLQINLDPKILAALSNRISQAIECELSVFFSITRHNKAAPPPHQL